ncbi:thiamine/molybdopterin biosynthesis protein MoeB [Paenibacillus baekrokdamisoli]|uniref:Thiamine/molybdopterin biosynthesis protein MoeB n=1 Tax=Paenibacillus baekrokdamisoli TaxID=1712516 RepID=A0A3G9J1D6_9BACL|nr:ThiF family adenylyltransferase [Paenibacillus baekrokdamisoli]MBB3069429.1 adenylyltransferase/sulfurtransferase [Paenibacillus baekrokdamisoli]BBH24997.1 thiamine/molybdopterin biosynthesis protein MoeB [Paenibacillus baekrokdamisoli]
MRNGSEFALLGQETSPSEAMNSGDDRWAERYSRQTRFAPIGLEGQSRIGNSCVLIVGCGALGASLAQHMVRAGVGEVRLVDRDFVEPSNLQRQMLFDEADALASLPKAVVAAAKLRQINSTIHIEPFVIDMTAEYASKLADGVDLILDGTDNAATRLVLNDVSYRYGIPFLYGGVAGAQGMSAMLVPGETACLRCLVGNEEEEAGETCDTLGVISPIVEWIAAIQAAEALKWLSGNKDALRRTWLTANLWPYSVKESALPGPSKHCQHCGQSAEMKEFQVIETGLEVSRTAILCGRDMIQVTLAHTLDLAVMRQLLTSRGCEVTANPYLIRAQLAGGERLVLFSDGRILVQGTQDVEHALALCNLYVVESFEAKGELLIESS